MTVPANCVVRNTSLYLAAVCTTCVCVCALCAFAAAVKHVVVVVVGVCRRGAPLGGASAAGGKSWSARSVEDFQTMRDNMRSIVQRGGGGGGGGGDVSCECSLAR